MAETNNRQQDMQENARRLAAQQAEAQRILRQRQQAAKKVQQETAGKLRQERSVSRAAAEEEGSERLRHWGNVGYWFQIFCWMHIPIFGFWYMVVTALRRKNSEEKRAFARAYVLYRVLVFILALTLLYVFYRMGVSFLEQILAYIDLHS